MLYMQVIYKGVDNLMKIQKLTESKNIVEEVVSPKPNGYHSVWDITDTIGVHNDGGVYHVFDRANGNKYLLNTESIEELNNYLNSNHGKTIVDPEPKSKPVEEPKKRYPIYMWDAIEKAVANISEIPEEHKEEFISIVGDRATKKKVPRAGWKAAKLPRALVAKYPELDSYGRDNYNSFLPFGESAKNVIGLTLEEALLEIYDVMKNKWFKQTNESVESEKTFKPGDTVYVKPSKKTGKVLNVNGDYIKVEINGGADPDRIDTFYSSDLELTTNEAFDVDKVAKRIARHNEFDNGYVLHNYEKMTSAEAEEKARLASIENPDDIYYVSYDNIMEPCSDIKWKNGKQLNEDTMLDDVDEKPYTKEQIEKDLKSLTNNFTVEGDTLKCGFKEEAEYSEEILSRYYASVEIDKVGSWFQVEFKDRLEKHKKVTEGVDEFNSLTEGIEVATIADYIVDHYDFDDIDDKYSCINSIRDSFKNEKTISKEELEQFIGSHNGKDKVEESINSSDPAWDEIQAMRDEEKDKPTPEWKDKSYYEFYNDFIIISNPAGDGYDIYSYDSYSEKLYCEDEGIAKPQYDKAEIDKWISDSRIDEAYTDYKKGDWVEYNLSVKPGVKHIIPVKVADDLGSDFYGWAWGEGYHKYRKSGIVGKIDMDDTDAIIKKYSLTEASYGGAYDIADDQYFTRDDLDNFGDVVLGHVSETFNGLYDIGGVWFENGNLITKIVSEDGSEYEDTTKVDMRRIRQPYHLKLVYGPEVAARIIQQIKDINGDVMVENLKENYNDNPEIYDEILVRLENIAKLAGDKDLRYDEKVTPEHIRHIWLFLEDEVAYLKDAVDAMNKWDKEMNESVDDVVTEESEIMSPEGMQIAAEGNIGRRVKQTWANPANIGTVIDGKYDPNEGIMLLVEWDYSDTEDIEWVRADAVSDYLEESLTESSDIEIDTLEGPKEGPEFGIATLLNDAIKDEVDAVQTYN